VSRLSRLHRAADFDSADDVRRFEARLATLVERGKLAVEPARKHRSSLAAEVWFRDTRDGTVFRYVAPDWPSRGHWGPVDAPDTPSFFEALCPDLYPTRPQHAALVRALDAAWVAGTVACATYTTPSELEDVFVHHVASGETYDLTLANPYQKGGCWMKVHFTWPPPETVVGAPPWRRWPDGGTP
jgi:hypothetical protein